MTDTRRIASLDGLRALAIILVLMLHISRPFLNGVGGLAAGPFKISAFFINGWVGVDLFFVLSGFLIADHLLHKGIMQQSLPHGILRQYFGRRFFRVAPAYYVILTFALLGAFKLYPLTPVSSFGNGAWRYIYHLVFMHDYGGLDICGVFWSLAVEFKFYLIAPFLLIGLGRLQTDRQRFIILGLLIVLSIMARYLTAMPYGAELPYSVFLSQLRIKFHLSLDSIISGVACAFLIRNEFFNSFMSKPRRADIFFLSGSATIMGLIGLGPLLNSGVSITVASLLPSILAIGFSLMLLGLLKESAADRLFGWRGFQPLATVSYSLYLTHIFVRSAAINMMAQTSFYPSGQLGRLFVTLPVFLTMALMLASVLYFAIERPFLNWSKHYFSSMDRS